MTKTDLLTKASRHFSLTRRVKAFAAQSLSDAQISVLHAPAARRAAVLDKAHTWLCWLAFVGSILAVSIGEGPYSDSVANGFVGIVVGLVGVFLLTLIYNLQEFALGYDKASQLLAPLAGTDECKRGVNLIKEGGPDVAAWRDVALAERSQLYSFDLEVMQALSWLHYADTRDAKEKAERDEACRELHGIDLPAVPGTVSTLKS